MVEVLSSGNPSLAKQRKEAVPPILKARHMRQSLWILLLGALCISTTAPAGFAQQAEIDTLASRVAQRIAAKGKKKVAVADFVGVNGKSVPLGAWLADRFSVALVKAGPGLEIIDRAKLKAPVETRPLFSKDSQELDFGAARSLCHSVGAEILVSASLGPAEKAVGITLDSLDCLRRGRPQQDWVPPTTGEIPLTPEMEALLPGPLESLLLRGGVWRAGQGGAGQPSCIHCPSPSFPGEAVIRKERGEVRMEVTVTVDGRATDIKVIKGGGYGFDEKAIEAVRGWKFKPALGPDATPVPVRTVVEVTFRWL